MTSSVSFCRIHCFWIWAIFAGLAHSIGLGQVVDSLNEQDHVFKDTIRPIIEKYCGDCHAGDGAEADFDLVSPRTIRDLRNNSEMWMRVREVLDTEQMPPPESQPIPDDERNRLRLWVHDWLKAEAKSNSGDPGPVLLRRLSNAEYNYSVQELTGVPSLMPSKEFPVDGAAGEGFTNTGSAQGMSPALATKYLDAAKEIATHLVFLPDQLAFSEFTTRRDQTDELIHKIQDFYGRFTNDRGGTTVDLQGIKFDTNQGGRLPLAKYLAATLTFRDELQDGRITISEVAEKEKLSPHYLQKLWNALTTQSLEANEFHMASIRGKWKTISNNDVVDLAAEIESIMQSQWRFNPVGQIGRQGGPTAWMEEISPFVVKQEFRLPLTPNGDDVSVFLSVEKLAADSISNMVVWNNPRLEYSNGHSPINLRDLKSLSGNIESIMAEEFIRFGEYLDAIAELNESESTLEQIASIRGLKPRLLIALSRLLGIGKLSPEIGGLLVEPLKNINGNAALNGWGSAETPSIISNQSAETISFSTLVLPPGSLFVHPSPQFESTVIWKSPIDGIVQVTGLLADADNNCGNGFSWTLQLQSAMGRRNINSGVVENGGQYPLEPSEDITVHIGDWIVLSVNPQNADHSCDTTRIEIQITETNNHKRCWNVVSDTVNHIQNSNPLPDSYGNGAVWYFAKQPINEVSHSDIPRNSALEHWKQAYLDDDKIESHRLGLVVQNLVTRKNEELTSADLELRNVLTNWVGPLDWLSLARDQTHHQNSEYGVDGNRFGTASDGSAIDPTSICECATSLLEIRIPKWLAADATFSVEGTLHSSNESNATSGCVQLNVSTRKLTNSVDLSGKLLVDGSLLPQFEAAAKRFRESFPAALCYSEIVPVDEVVTLTLLYREDDKLRSLMLDEVQCATLDRLWQQLYYVSQEPILLTTVFEQISEFATQDRPDLVEAFAPMRTPIYKRADRFRQELLESEASHINSLLKVARMAWRRPLSSKEEEDLRTLYHDLRDSDVAHDDAIRMVLARVLASPAFLYRIEHAGVGVDPIPISDYELATRLSYFLWSSPPDQALLTVAESGELTKGNSTLHDQTHRMLADGKTRRLAIQFACQWLHIRDFDKNNDKNERTFPEFGELRDDMYQETVLFFEDMFQNDGCILDIIDGNHTFANKPLAEFYGFADQANDLGDTEWSRVEGIRDLGRGGVLGMASILASQSGASRSSPILRGNWLSETMLGERLPRPPPNIPVLPESVPDGLTARQLIELHSSQPECARCHIRIDPFGFALEQFDGIGRTRPEAADTRAQLKDGTNLDGLGGVIDYLIDKRRDDVVRQFCRKLLGFALGREVILSDEVLLDEMQRKLSENEFRFSVAVDCIVTSPQFLRIRGRLSDPQGK